MASSSIPNSHKQAFARSTSLAHPPQSNCCKMSSNQRRIRDAIFKSLPILPSTPGGPAKIC
eukprot:6093958-Karenia_brevis.AAC.1